MAATKNGGGASPMTTIVTESNETRGRKGPTGPVAHQEPAKGVSSSRGGRGHRQWRENRGGGRKGNGSSGLIPVTSGRFLQRAASWRSGEARRHLGLARGDRNRRLSSGFGGLGFRCGDETGEEERESAREEGGGGQARLLQALSPPCGDGGGTNHLAGDGRRAR
jgi:hypothetical protein